MERRRRRSADNVANSPASGFAPVRLRRLGARQQAGDRAGERFSRQHGYRCAVVNDLYRLAISERVPGRCASDLDLQGASSRTKGEGESGESLGQPWREAEDTAAVAHAAEAGHERDPGARERGDVQAVAGVVLDVIEVHQRCLAEVVMGKAQMADLSGDDGLAARRKR